MIFKDKGYIGQFSMETPEQGKQQLLAYIKELKELGHDRIIGPINGNTWNSYRLISYSNDTVANFPLEPTNPLWYNDVYLDVGFKPLQKYYSEIFDIGYVVRFNNGIDIRNFRTDDFETLYNIANVSFARNFLYETVSFEEFTRIYGSPMKEKLDDGYIALAYINNEPVGFIFSFVFNKTLILKSMAVLPPYRSHGVGAALINYVCLQAKKDGIDKAIGALISSNNHSGKIVSKYGSKIFREYTLYEYTELS